MAQQPTTDSEPARDEERPPTEGLDRARQGTDETVTLSGWRVYVDPATGVILSVPTEAHRQAELQSAQQELSDEARLQWSSEGLEVFELEGGGIGVDLRGRFQHALEVSVDPATGVLATSCADGSGSHAVHEHGAAASTSSTRARSEKSASPEVQ